MGREATMRRVAFTTLLLRCIFPSSPIPPLRARDRGETEATEECMYFFLIFSPSLSFLPEQPVERRKGERRRRAVSQAAARLSSALFIPTCFSPATFILFKVEDGEDRRGHQEEKARRAIASLMITQQKTCTATRKIRESVGLFFRHSRRDGVYLERETGVYFRNATEIISLRFN